ncbi:MAG TPA: helix-turn-helix domain-containing protein [Microbacterium sp.]|uniref:helix-turn-helix transcriptional regulator n=1 Tax=Microbacterium sp. TaxID=51671 RepID=UPI002B497CA7|nr:helix-turn-helix domain-containing protein [Microbacterium sp.]HKT57901.1 helix-turn-helix domain-containing protein [Microbacterium sp.]
MNERTIRPLMTIDEVAEILRVPVKTIYEWRSRPLPYGPPAIKVGRYLRWKVTTVEAWIEGQEPDAVPHGHA